MDNLRIRSEAGKDGLVWRFDEEGMAECKVELDQPPSDLVVKAGGLWEVALVKKKKASRGRGQSVAVVRLILKIQEMVLPFQDGILVYMIVNKRRVDSCFVILNC